MIAQFKRQLHYFRKFTKITFSYFLVQLPQRAIPFMGLEIYWIHGDLEGKEEVSWMSTDVWLVSTTFLLIMTYEHIDQVSNIVKDKVGNNYPGEPERTKRSMEAIHNILFNAYSVLIATLMHIFKLPFSNLRDSFLNIFVLKPSHKSNYRVYI